MNLGTVKPKAPEAPAARGENPHHPEYTAAVKETAAEIVAGYEAQETPGLRRFRLKMLRERAKSSPAGPGRDALRLALFAIDRKGSGS